MSGGVFDDYSVYYDLLYQDKDYNNEAKYVFNTLKEYLPNSKTVVELGMGTGIHAELLEKKGLSVEGIELSESMAKIASKKGLICSVANCTDFSLSKKFDAAISLFHVISYLTSNDDLIKTLKNVHNHLKDDGIFMFDVWYSPAVYILKPEIRVKRLANAKKNVTRIAEPVNHYNNNVIDVNYDIFVESIVTSTTKNFQETHPMRHFSLPELNLLATLTGFNVLKAEEWISKKEPSQNTWGVCNIWQKK